MCQKQSHYIEVAQGAILMEQNMIFGLILGWSAIMKNNEKRFGADYEQFLRVFFHVFMGKIKFLFL